MTAHIAIQADGSKIGGKLLNVFTLEHETAASAAKHFRDSGYRVAVREPGHIVHVWDTAKARANVRNYGKPGVHWTSALAWMETAHGRMRRRSGNHSHPAHPYSHPVATRHRRAR